MKITRHFQHKMSTFLLILYILDTTAGIDLMFEENAPTSGNTSSADPDLKSYHSVLFITTTSLSAFGSFAIIVTYYLWPDLQTTTRKILVYIAFADFMVCYPSLIIFWKNEYDNNGIPCKVQSFVTTAAAMWSFFWTTSLAIYLYIALVKKRPDISEKLMVTFHLINWWLPLLLVGAAFYQGQLGCTKGETTVGWCWIVIGNGLELKQEVIWMLICGKLWEIISYFINCILYLYTARSIKEEVSERMHLMSPQCVVIAQQGRGKLMLFPVIFVGLRMWGTLRFFRFAFSIYLSHTINEVLIILQLIGDNAQGVTNFVLFCLLTEKFKQQIRRVVRMRRRHKFGRRTSELLDPEIYKTFREAKGPYLSCDN